MVGMEDKAFYTVTDLAKLFGINHVTVRNLIKRGDIRAMKIGRSLRVSEAALSEYLKWIEYGKYRAEEVDDKTESAA